jgi:hydroxymethylbilane synthase
MKPLRIGTRGSALALWQANHVKDKLAELHGVQAELVRIQTSGDRFQSASLAQIGAEAGTKGVFIKEIEDALLAGDVDLAVHSMKDVPTEIPSGLVFSAIPKREDPRDCLISRAGLALKDLSNGARVGTSSLRRQAQLRHRRSDLDVVDVRGNVDTRIKKLEAGEFEAIVLALAGVNRLGLTSKITETFESNVMLPAVGQGALGVETRECDAETSQLVAALDDSDTSACVTAERALLHELQGGCQVPMGALGQILDGVLRLEAAVFSADGSDFVRCDESGSPREARAIGIRLGQSLLERGADRILRLAGRPVGNN